MDKPCHGERNPHDMVSIINVKVWRECISKLTNGNESLHELVMVMELE
jgi:hypothetical protein